jgi:hypothetical protein
MKIRILNNFKLKFMSTKTYFCSLGANELVAHLYR